MSRRYDTARITDFLPRKELHNFIDQFPIDLDVQVNRNLELRRS